MCSNLNGRHTLNSSCWGRPREGCERFCLFSKHWWRFGRWEEPSEILRIILEDFSLPGCHPDISQESLTVDVHGWWSGFYFFFCCSPQTVLRVWDCLFYEGSKILFRVALTLIRHNEALIQQAQSLPDVCQTFKQMTHGALVDNCHVFMQVQGKIQTSAQVTQRV